MSKGKTFAEWRGHQVHLSLAKVLNPSQIIKNNKLSAINATVVPEIGMGARQDVPRASAVKLGQVKVIMTLTFSDPTLPSQGQASCKSMCDGVKVSQLGPGGVGVIY